jgi:hypothetical protein
VIAGVIWLEPKMRIRTRFSIKFLLLLTGIVALVLTVIRYRPSPEIRVTFYSNGRVTLQDEPIDTETLRETIDRERTWRKLWIQTSEVAIVLPESFLMDRNALLKQATHKTLDEPINPRPKKLSYFRIEDIMELLKKHKLSDLENVILAGVNTEHFIVIAGVNTESSNATNAK